MENLPTPVKKNKSVDTIAVPQNMMLMLCAIRLISSGVFGTKTGGNKKPIAVPSWKARKENQKSFPWEHKN